MTKLKKRIIPCLDIDNGKTVKGVNFVDIKFAGDPVVLAKKYAKDGADELVFLDITATVEKRETLVSVVEKIAKEIHIPFTVGGGIRLVEDARKLFMAGADKISINSSAVANPELIRELSEAFGSQATVVAIDTKYENNQWDVYVHGGRTKTKWKTIDWAKKAEQMGAGELLITSMNNDGTKNGFALDLLQEINECSTLPIIASGGAGSVDHFYDLFKTTNVNAGLAASIFHFNELPIPQLKTELRNRKIWIR